MNRFSNNTHAFISFSGVYLSFHLANVNFEFVTKEQTVRTTEKLPPASTPGAGQSRDHSRQGMHACIQGSQCYATSCARSQPLRRVGTEPNTPRGDNSPT